MTVSVVYTDNRTLVGVKVVSTFVLEGEITFIQSSQSGLTESYIFFPFQCKALQRLVFDIFPSKMSYKVLFLIEKKKFQNKKKL